MTLRTLRETKGLTQAQVATRSGIKQSHVSQIELGKVRSPQYDTMVALARALEVGVPDIAAALAETNASRVA